MSLFGLTRQKPRHYRDMLRIVWENRDELPFAWRILRDGVCDGCALGTSGLSDWTLQGTHLCMVRLELMRLNTAPSLEPTVLSDVRPLTGTTSAGLRALGRIPYGETRSYAQLAAAIGRPTATRAVGAANGQNPIPIIIPCHRVIGAGGSLVGFGGGLDVKRWLLAHEGGGRLF